MARRQHFVLGPNFDDDRLVTNQDDPGGDFTTPTTTNTSGLSPVGSDRWMRVDKGSLVLVRHNKSEAITAEDYAWLVISSFAKEGGSTSSKVCFIKTDFPSFPALELKLNSSPPVPVGQYRIEVVNNSISLLTSGDISEDSEQVNIWIQLDGTNVEMRINGVSVGTAAFAGKLNETGFFTTPASMAGGSDAVYYSGIGLFGGDAESDRPGFEMETELIEANGDYATYQDYGDDADCASTDGVYTDVTLSSLAVDATSNLCELGGDAGEQGLETETPSMTGIEGIVARFAARSNVFGKTVETYTKIIDASTNETEKAHSNINHTAIYGAALAFADPPTGSWDDMIAGMKVGIRSLDTNGANDNWYGFCVEVGKPIAFPTGALPADRRRGAGQVC